MIKIIFFGSSNYVIPIVEALNSNFTLYLVVTTENSLKEPVPKYCASNKIPYVSLSSLTDPGFNLKLLNFEIDVGIVADFGLFIPPFLINAFHNGLLNIHPSLLPQYRGSSPAQWSILNGDKETGATVIKLDEQLDHGPIIAQKKELICPNDTTDALYKRLFKIGNDLLMENLKNYIEGKITPVAQDDTKAIYTKQLSKNDGYIDLTNPPSPQKLERMIKAYYPWPGVWTKVQLETKNKELRTVKFLPNEKIQIEGGNPMSYKDFINGYPEDAKMLQILKL